jgi:phage-related protein
MQDVWDKITKTINNVWHYIHDLKWGEIFTNIGKDVGNAIIDLVQGAINGAFSHIPGHPSVNLPHFANGVTNFGGGLAVVGERGAEVVNLPKGSDVIPHNKTGSISGDINVTVNMGMYAGMPVEKREIAMSLWRELVRTARAQGVNLPNIGSVIVQ